MQEDIFVKEFKKISKKNNKWILLGSLLIKQSKNYNCSIITMPPSIIEKISKFGKTYRELTLDTVKKFLKDSKKSNFKL